MCVYIYVCGVSHWGTRGPRAEGGGGVAWGVRCAMQALESTSLLNLTTAHPPQPDHVTMSGEAHSLIMCDHLTSLQHKPQTCMYTRRMCICLFPIHLLAPPLPFNHLPTSFIPCGIGPPRPPLSTHPSSPQPSTHTLTHSHSLTHTPTRTSPPLHPPTGSQAVPHSPGHHKKIHRPCPGRPPQTQHPTGRVGACGRGHLCGYGGPALGHALKAGL